MGQTARSTQAVDYQDIDRPLAVMVKEFSDRATTGEHAHRRGQLLHAVEGVMLARTRSGAWIVPPGHALWLPPTQLHEVEMRGRVSMWTVYVRPEEASRLDARCRVIRVPALLREAILALATEPVLYDRSGRGSHLAAIVIDEIARASTAAFELPMATDKRIMAICNSLIADPALELTIDQWADRVGAGRRTLTRSFRLETGLSFGEWRRRLRAMSALAHFGAGDPVGVTAGKVGYRSPSALTAMIRRKAEAES